MHSHTEPSLPDVAYTHPLVVPYHRYIVIYLSLHPLTVPYRTITLDSPNERTSPPSALPGPSGRGPVVGDATRFMSCRRQDSERPECNSNATIHPVDATLGRFQKWRGLYRCPCSQIHVPAEPITHSFQSSPAIFGDAKYQDGLVVCLNRLVWTPLSHFRDCSILRGQRL